MSDRFVPATPGDTQEVIDLMSKQIVTELRIAAQEQYAPGFDADTMDDNIKHAKQRAAQLRQLRTAYEDVMSGVLRSTPRLSLPTDADDKIAQDLIRGDRGGFMAQIGEAFARADSGNRAALKAAFPHVFTG